MEKIKKNMEKIKKNMEKKDKLFFHMCSILLGLFLMFGCNFKLMPFWMGVGILLNSFVNFAFYILDEIFKDSNH
jgi:hypothetical protein